MSINCPTFLAEELVREHGWRYQRQLSNNRGTDIETHLLEAGDYVRAVLKVPSRGGPKNMAFERAYALRQAAGADLDAFAPRVLRKDKQNLGSYTLHPYVLVGYIEGRQMSPGIRYRDSGSSIRVGAAFRYATGALRALRGFHAKKLVHGDVKPDNLIHNSLDPINSTFLIDLDTMAEEGDPSLYPAINNYSAPESLQPRTCHRATDIFPVACGIVDILGGRLAELLPIVGTHPRESLKFKWDHLPNLADREAELQMVHQSYPEQDQALVRRLVRFAIPGLSMDPNQRPDVVTALSMLAAEKNNFEI